MLTPDGFKPMQTRPSIIEIKDAQPVTITLHWTENGPILPGSRFRSWHDHPARSCHQPWLDGADRPRHDAFGGNGPDAGTKRCRRHCGGRRLCRADPEPDAGRLENRCDEDDRRDAPAIGAAPKPGPHALARLAAGKPLAGPDDLCGEPRIRRSRGRHSGQYQQQDDRPAVPVPCQLPLGRHAADPALAAADAEPRGAYPRKLHRGAAGHRQLHRARAVAADRGRSVVHRRGRARRHARTSAPARACAAWPTGTAR